MGVGGFRCGLSARAYVAAYAAPARLTYFGVGVGVTWTEELFRGRAGGFFLFCLVPLFVVLFRRKLFVVQFLNKLPFGVALFHAFLAEGGSSHLFTRTRSHTNVSWSTSESSDKNKAT